MILVDSSVWVHHLRLGEPALCDLLIARQVLSHPIVIGEVALGSLRQRAMILGDLQNLPAAVRAGDDEVMVLIEARALHGRGIGYVDAHLLASTLLTPGARLWTRDRRLRSVADDLGLGVSVPEPGGSR
ncbi:MAG: type II toxin-antitoxin system VapC family toxin [Novosphingobium sp.]|nr:type II toxin-antitoxin system VapC family toxin [Novosphingobium sp.]